jgi:hypothetical protein
MNNAQNEVSSMSRKQANKEKVDGLEIQQSDSNKEQRN